MWEATCRKVQILTYSISEIDDKEDLEKRK